MVNRYPGRCESSTLRKPSRCAKNNRMIARGNRNRLVCRHQNRGCTPNGGGKSPKNSRDCYKSHCPCQFQFVLKMENEVGVSQRRIDELCKHQHFPLACLITNFQLAFTGISAWAESTVACGNAATNESVERESKMIESILCRCLCGKSKCA
jgi:hypothetical protein